MKKLICVKDVENSIKDGQKVLYIDNNTLITPAAKDAAKGCGIEFSFKQCETKSREPEKACDGEIDSSMIYKVLKTMMDKGLLKGLLDNGPGPPYQAEYSGGLKLVRGQSVKYDTFDTNNPNDKVFSQELISKNESSISAGFMTIETSNFNRQMSYEEIDYVVEGTLTVTINGNTFTAYSGDVIYIPSGSKVTWGSPDKAKIFYTTYSANCCDRMQN